MDFAFLLGYLGLLALTLYFARSTAWLVLSVVAGISIVGGLVSLVMDLGQHWTRIGLQLMLLLALALPAVFAFLTRKSGRSISRHQVLSIWAPFIALLLFFSIVVKFGSTMFHTPFPDYVKAIWAVIGTFFLLGCAYAYLNQRKADKYESEESNYDLSNPEVDVEPVMTKKNQ